MYKKRRGQALVEFSVAALVFFMLMIGSFQYFLIAQNKFALDTAGRMAVRKASVHPVHSVGCEKAKQDAIAEFRSYLKTTSFIADNKADNISVDLKCRRQDNPIGQFYLWELELTAAYDMDLILPFGSNKLRLNTTVLGLAEHMERANP